MAIYLGNKKYKLHIGSSAFVLAVKNLIDSIILRSSDGYLMKTSDGLYLTVKEGE